MNSNEQKRTDVNELGEFRLIEHLTASNKTRRASTLKSVGDDAAVLGTGGDEQMLVSTDMMVEGIHFDMTYTPLKHLGYKAVVSNLSDIYAMNATPTQITVSIALSNRYSVEALEEIYAGIYKACDMYNVDLVGGDTTSSNKGLVISITAIGKAKKEKIVYRNNAQIGDLLCVSGNLGAAYLGLQVLEREKQLFLSNPGIKPDLEEEHQYILERQLKPEPRRDIIDQFEKKGLVPTAMIDISDGLASDLFHICRQSGVGAVVEESGVPIHPQAEYMAVKFNLDPISAALSGGEDYELLFTIKPEDMDKVKYMTDIYVMGEIVPLEEGVKLHTKGGKIHPITASGWTHYNQ